MFFCNVVNAKTVGNYIGIDLIKTSTSFGMHQQYLDPKDNDKNPYTDPTPSYGYGLKYNYAINYRNFFLTAGLFYENNQNKNNFNKSSYAEYNQDYMYGKSFVKIKDRYGVKFDLGYDVNDNLAVYGSAGIVNNKYQISTSLYPYFHFNNEYPNIITDAKANTLPSNPFTTIKGNKKTPFIGAGIRIKLYKNWLLNGEYNFTKFSVNNKFSKVKNNSDNPNLTNFHNSISTLKFGINYNF
ncbi:MAG: outer membrane protein [Alphaproteobacteria bacterium]